MQSINKYLVLVTLNPRGRVVDLFSDEFGSLLDDYPGSPEYPKLYSHLSTRLLAKITTCLIENKVIPLPSQAKKTINNPQREFYMEVQIEFDLQKGFFYKNLPRLGIISNMVFVTISAFVTLLALKILFVRNFNLTQKVVDNLFAYLGASIGFIMMMLQFHFSKAIDNLEDFGRDIDSFFSGEKKQTNSRIANMTLSKLTLFYLVSYLLIIIAISFTILSSISVRQSIVSIINDAISEEIFNPLSERLVEGIAIAGALSGGIQGAAFNQTFIKLFLDYLEKKWAYSANNQNLNNLSEMPILPLNVINLEDTPLHMYHNITGYNSIPTDPLSEEHINNDSETDASRDSETPDSPHSLTDTPSDNHPL